MVASRENPQQRAMRWRPFLDWLICGIKDLEARHHKEEPLRSRSGWRRRRGWRRDTRSRFETRAQQLVDAGLMDWRSKYDPWWRVRQQGTLRELETDPNQPCSIASLPAPYLQQVKRTKNLKCFVAYLVARRVHGESEKLAQQIGLGEEALRQRIHQFRSELKESGRTETSVIEGEWALFRFYDMQPGVGEQNTADLPKFGPPFPLPAANLRELGLAPDDGRVRAMALSDWEREEIARLCSKESELRC